MVSLWNLNEGTSSLPWMVSLRTRRKWHGVVKIINVHLDHVPVTPSVWRFYWESLEIEDINTETHCRRRTHTWPWSLTEDWLSYVISTALQLRYQFIVFWLKVERVWDNGRANGSTYFTRRRSYFVFRVDRSLSHRRSAVYHSLT